ncbi:MAG: response regulator [Coriobacteriales bacterium]|jgi:putative two-component system response regulator|nr:response regulator [Coriobacteriales bacterium]
MNTKTIKKRKRIALVDDNMTSLAIGRNMLKELYEVYPVQSGGQLLEKMEMMRPDLILLDIEMPDMNGYETLRRLKERYDLLSTPVIFLTAKTDMRSEIEGLGLGAVDYIVKPFSAPLLMKRIETHMLVAEQGKQLKCYNGNLQEEVRLKTERVFSLQNAMLVTVSEMIESRDSVTGGHIERTQNFMRLLIEDLIANDVYTELIREWDLDLVLLSAPLHDTGKISISDALLNKPGKLTRDEFKIMQKHVEYGVRILEKVERSTCESSLLKYAKTIAGTHHEKWDGSGYPNGLKGKEIPLEGRLMAVADVYDALISIRPYKEALSFGDARRIMLEGKGSHFDPALIDSFTRVERLFIKVAQEYDWASSYDCERLAS